MELTPYTELDAINSMLAAINEAPLNSLSNLEDIDAIAARRILQQVNRQFQSRGWSFNSFEDYVYNPDALTHKITWVNNILYIKCNDYKITKRGDYMYNLDDQTFIFNAPITADVILYFNLEDLPETARNYVIAKATTIFESQYLGDSELTPILTQREQEAWMYFNDYEHTVVTNNMLANTYIAGVKER